MKVNGWQRGYGFVHYSASLSGINASLSCVEALRDGVADGIHFKCSISHKLEVMLNERDIPFDRTKTAFTPIPRAAGASTQWTMALPAWGMAPSISSFPMCSAGSQTDSASEMGYALPPHYFQMPYFNMIPAWAYDPRRATQYITSGGVSFPPQYPAMHIPIPPPFIPMPIQHPVHRGQHWDNRQVDGAGSSGSTESMDTAADEHSVDHHRVVHGVPARNHPSSQTISHQAMSDNFKPNGHITPASAMQPLQQGASSERDAGMEPYHRRRSTHQ